MRRAVIIHCWHGVPDSRWYPNTKEELEALGFDVDVPLMPETEAPTLENWLPRLRGVIGVPDDDLFLIGHSIGVITILRYLELLGENQKIGGIILVAGFTDKLTGVAGIENELESFFKTRIDWKKIRHSVRNKIVAIHSDDDPYVDLKYSEIFKQKLNAQVIVKHKMGHFSEPDGGGDEKTIKELPDVAQVIRDMHQ